MTRAKIDESLVGLVRYLIKRGAKKDDIEMALAGALFDLKAKEFKPE